MLTKLEQQPPNTSTVSRLLAVGLATSAGLGFAPKAPGTVGSFAAVVIFLLYFRSSFASVADMSAAILLLIVIGCWASQRAGELFECEDDGRIVIDEVAGQFLALLPLGFALGVLPAVGAEGIRFTPEFYFWVVTGFVLFRVLDIWKPGPIGWADRELPGGIGVMFDDVIAGAIVAFVLGASLWLAQALGLSIQFVAGGS